MEEITIRIEKSAIDNYKSICDYLEQHPTRTDWVNVKQKMERELLQLVIDKVKEL